MEELDPQISAALCRGGRAILDYDALLWAASNTEPAAFERQMRAATGRVDAVVKANLERWLKRVIATVRVAQTLAAVGAEPEAGEMTSYGLLLNQLREHRAQGVFFLTSTAANAVWLDHVIAKYSREGGRRAGESTPLHPTLDDTRADAATPLTPTLHRCRTEQSPLLNVPLSKSASARPRRARKLSADMSPALVQLRKPTFAKQPPPAGHGVSGSPGFFEAISLADSTRSCASSAASLDASVAPHVDPGRLSDDVGALGFLTTAAHTVATALAAVDHWNCVVYRTFSKRQLAGASPPALHQGIAFRKDTLLDLCLRLARKHRAHLPPGFVSCAYAAAAGVAPPAPRQALHPDWPVLPDMTPPQPPRAPPKARGKVLVPAWLLPSKARARAKRNAKTWAGRDLERNELIARFGYPQGLTDAYELSHEVLGRGTFAVVHRAKCKDGGAVAVKTIVAAWSTKVMAQRAYRETNIMQQLSHPCILPVIDVFSSAASPNLHVVLPLLPKSLADLVASGVLSPAERRWCVLQVLSGVAYMHRRGVVHRDLKPSNILATVPRRGERDGAHALHSVAGAGTPATASHIDAAAEDVSTGTSVRIFISDFGLARTTGGAPPDVMSHHGPTYIQSLWYRAPEVVLADSPGFAHVEPPASPHGIPELRAPDSPSVASCISLPSAPCSPKRPIVRGAVPVPPQPPFADAPYITVTHPATPRGAGSAEKLPCAQHPDSSMITLDGGAVSGVVSSACTSVRTAASDCERGGSPPSLTLDDATEAGQGEQKLGVGASTDGSSVTSENGDAVCCAEGVRALQCTPAKSCLRRQDSDAEPIERSRSASTFLRPPPLNFGGRSSACSIASSDALPPPSPALSVAEAATDTACDMWSIGCIVYEVMTAIPLFPGQDEQHQRELLHSVSGDAVAVRERSIRDVLQGLQGASGISVGAVGTKLIEGLCERHPERRLTAEAALGVALVWVEEVPEYADSPAVAEVVRKGQPYVGEGPVVLDLPCNAVREVSQYRDGIWGRSEHRLHQRQRYYAIQRHSAATAVQRFWRSRREPAPRGPPSPASWSRQSPPQAPNAQPVVRAGQWSLPSTPGSSGRPPSRDLRARAGGPAERRAAKMHTPWAPVRAVKVAPGAPLVPSSPDSEALVTSSAFPREASCAVCTVQ